MKFFTAKKTETVDCVVGVTSGCAVAAVVKHYHADDAVDRPIVLFMHREPVVLRDGVSDALLAEAAAAATRRAVNACRAWNAAHHGNAFDRLICAVGEPWSVTVVRTPRVEKTKPMRITQKMVDEAVARDRKLLEADISNRATALLELVQMTRVAAEVNGYLVDNPVGETGTTVSLSMVYGLVDAGMLDELSGVFVDVLHRDDVKFETLDIARLRSIPRHISTQVLDIGGISTTLTTVLRGAPAPGIVIPMGLGAVTEHIAKLFETTPARIASVMAFATDEQLLEHERDEYYRRIELAYRPLGILIERAADELRRVHGVIPDRTLVVGVPAWGSALYPLIAKSMQTKIVLPDYAHDRVVYAHGVTRDDMISMIIDEGRSVG